VSLQCIAINFAQSSKLPGQSQRRYRRATFKEVTLAQYQGKAAFAGSKISSRDSGSLRTVSNGFRLCESISKFGEIKKRERKFLKVFKINNLFDLPPRGVTWVENKGDRITLH
jgi:hypothetical protein